MRFSITFKLFLALLLTSMVLALAMGMAVRYSFDRGFELYIQEREHQRLDAMAQILANDYEQTGSWKFLKNNRGRWWRSLRLAHRSDPAADDRSFLARLVLLDAREQWLAGPRLKDTAGMRRYPVTVNGQAVAWLLSPPLMPAAISDQLDRQFQASQLRATWVIIGLSVLLAIVVSLLLARILLVPLQRMTRAIHRLAAGDYSKRVPVSGSDELARLARDFNLLADSLQRNEQLRRELMADVSHELRTPLSVLRGEVEALQDGLRTADEKSLASLAHEINLLSQLVDDLYELSLADAGALNYRMRNVDLGSHLQAVLAAMQERMQRQGLTLVADIEAGLIVQADAGRLDQLLTNLLENSLRYTDAPGRVEVRACLARTHVLLELSDSAPAVASHHLPLLFDRLYRVEPSRSREYGGAGLGLAICQRIAQAHGASISAHASALGGLLIRLRWPRADTPAAGRFAPDGGATK